MQKLKVSNLSYERIHEFCQQLTTCFKDSDYNREETVAGLIFAAVYSLLMGGNDKESSLSIFEQIYDLMDSHKEEFLRELDKLGKNEPI